MFNRIARFYISLGLPEFWSISHEDEREGKYYISPNCSLKIFVHPSFRYIEDLLEMAKTKEIKIVLESRHNNQKMKFYDIFQRDFEVDILDIVNEMRENKAISKVLNYVKMNEEFNNKEKHLDDASYYLSENFMTEEETKEEIFLFRQKIIEKNKTKKFLY